MKNARSQTTETSARKRNFNPSGDLLSDFVPSAAIVATHQQKFTGTNNPRDLHALHFLMKCPMTREHLDKAVGCANSPDLIFRLRQKGLEIPCLKIDAIDRDGKPCRPGVFYLTDADRKKINRWLASRQKGFIDPCLAGLVAMACVCVVLLVGAV